MKKTIYDFEKKYEVQDDLLNEGAGEGLIKVGSSLVPFVNKFPKNTNLYNLMTTKPGEVLNE